MVGIAVEGVPREGGPETGPRLDFDFDPLPLAHGPVPLSQSDGLIPRSRHTAQTITTKRIARHTQKKTSSSLTRPALPQRGPWK